MTPIPAATSITIDPSGPLHFTAQVRSPQSPPAPPTRLDPAPPVPSTPPTTAQLRAVVKDQFGEPFSDSVAWSSTNEAVASVDSSGCVTRRVAGTCSIIATAHSNDAVSARISCEVDA
jgi:Bacterial Ig-like domain (group 2)